MRKGAAVRFIHTRRVQPEKAAAIAGHLQSDLRCLALLHDKAQLIFWIQFTSWEEWVFRAFLYTPLPVNWSNGFFPALRGPLNGVHGHIIVLTAGKKPQHGINRPHRLGILNKECNSHLTPLNFAGALFKWTFALQARLVGEVFAIECGSRPITVLLRFPTISFLSSCIVWSVLKKSIYTNQFGIWQGWSLNEKTAYMEGSYSYSAEFCLFGEGWRTEMGLLPESLQGDLVLLQGL